MSRDRSLEKVDPLPADDGLPWDAEIACPDADQVTLHPPTSSRAALGDVPIRVGIVEFRIMLFLAKWPYHAFTRRQIAEGVSTHLRPLSEASVDDYVGSLRDQLGVFHDYVQTVPHVGYRFKA